MSFPCVTRESFSLFQKDYRVKTDNDTFFDTPTATTSFHTNKKVV